MNWRLQCFWSKFHKKLWNAILEHFPQQETNEEAELYFLRLWKTFLIKNAINKMRKLKIFINIFLFFGKFSKLGKKRAVFEKFKYEKTSRWGRKRSGAKKMPCWPNKIATKVFMISKWHKYREKQTKKFYPRSSH